MPFSTLSLKELPREMKFENWKDYLSAHLESYSEAKFEDCIHEKKSFKSKTEFFSLPDILVLVPPLEFQQIPLENLDMSHFVHKTENNPFLDCKSTVYDAIAVLQFIGESGQGHYFIDIREKEKKNLFGLVTTMEKIQKYCFTTKLMKW